MKRSQRSGVAAALREVLYEEELLIFASSCASAPLALVDDGDSKPPTGQEHLDPPQPIESRPPCVDATDRLEASFAFMGEDRWREKHFEALSPATPVVWTGWAEDADGLSVAFADDLQLAPGQHVRVRDISQRGVPPQVGDTIRQEEGVVVGEVWDDPDGTRFVRVRLSPTTPG